MSFRVVIPVRYASSRLPGKPLADIAGKSMVQHVYERALASGADEVIVATDDERILAVSEGFGAPSVMTRGDHASGTDRIAEVVERLRWSQDQVVVNVQGDEPLIPPANIAQVASLLENGDGDMSTLATPIGSVEEYLDPNVVKVVAREDGAALYFSRAPIPWHRDGAEGGLVSQTRFDGALRHVGLYGYRVAALKRLAAADACSLEQAERLEQLRALWTGLVLRVAVAAEKPGPGVDTPDDLHRVRALV